MIIVIITYIITILDKHSEGQLFIHKQTTNFHTRNSNIFDMQSK